jgi:uncharacterized protein YjgD (DUF1641 family)
MNDEIKKLIEELEVIVLDMYRNASDLDQWIQHVERTINDETIDPELKNLHIMMNASYRRDVKRLKNFNSLDGREESVWERLILSTDPNRVIEEQES